MSFAVRALLVTETLVLRGEQPDAGEPGRRRRRHTLVEVAEAGPAEVRPHEVRPPQVACRAHRRETISCLQLLDALRLHRRPVELHLGRAGRAVGRRRATRRVQHRLGVRPLLSPAHRSRGADAGGLDLSGDAARPDQQAPRRRDGDGHPVPAPGGAGEHGGHGRHRVGRTVGARRRCRLVRARVRGLRDRTGLDHATLRPPGGGLDRDPVAADRADDDVRRALLPPPRRLVRTEVGAATAPADRARRQGRATVAPTGGAPRRPLELLRRGPGGVRPAARPIERAVRGRGPAASTTSRCRPTSGRRPRTRTASPTRSPPTTRPEPT